ncbi:IS3 family transposase [Agromyces sp. MMS24-K17]|uniref:IS3 family transposase n=1 Tax=Agromyces sp. MMS24-K17 TaxID=3372850 RepID=UPI003753F6CC
MRWRGPWRTVEQVELATLEYVWWWNNERLHGELDLRSDRGRAGPLRWPRIRPAGNSRARPPAVAGASRTLAQQFLQAALSWLGILPDGAAG